MLDARSPSHIIRVAGKRGTAAQFVHSLLQGLECGCESPGETPSTLQALVSVLRQVNICFVCGLSPMQCTRPLFMWISRYPTQQEGEGKGI
jgi:hypothetical protein